MVAISVVGVSVQEPLALVCEREVRLFKSANSNPDYKAISVAESVSAGSPTVSTREAIPAKNLSMVTCSMVIETALKLKIS